MLVDKNVGFDNVDKFIAFVEKINAKKIDFNLNGVVDKDHQSFTVNWKEEEDL